MRMPFTNTNSRGDTIVEVLISMSILALVMGAAYATTNRSLRAGMDAGIRSQATSFAQQQVEILKSIALHHPEDIADYKIVDSPFCINPTNLDRITDLTNCKLPIGSPDPSQPYSVVINYFDSVAPAGNPKNTFVIKTEWPSSTTANSNGTVTLHYKPQGNYTQPAGETNICGSCTDTDIAAPNQPFVSLTSSPASVTPGGRVTLTWQTRFVDSCKAEPNNGAMGWSGSKAPISSTVTTVTASQPNIGPINSGVTFGIECRRTGVPTPVTATATVNVLPPPTVTIGSASAITTNSATLNGQVNPNGSATTYYFNYGTTTGYGSTAPAPSASAGSGSSNQNTSANIGGLAQSTRYYFRLCAVNPSGTSCSGSNSFVTATPPAPAVSLWVDNPSIGHGGSTTLRWSVSGSASSCSAWGSWGGNPSVSGGATGTGGLGGPSTYYYYMNCSGPGGTSPTASASVSVAGPPPPPPDCTSSAGGWRVWDGNWVQFSGGGGGCSFWRNSVVGDNGGGVWGPTWSPGWFCHTQSGYVHGWGWLSSADWCG